MDDAPDVTHLLQSMRGGDEAALPRLMDALQDEMHALAQRHLRRERKAHTLQPTALLNEAYVRLVDQRKQDWENRAQFMAIASTAMRRVLMQHAARRGAEKRGGGRLRVTAVDPTALDAPSEDMLALDEALQQLEEFDPEGAKLVDLRFFGGLTVEEVAEVTGTPLRTVERRWRAVRAWLRGRIDPGSADG